MAKGRAQCIVIRDGKILAAVHRHNGEDIYVIPGGGIEAGETPEQAALRELREEANVEGRIVRRLGEYINPYYPQKTFYNFLIDIGEQEVTLGYDPELIDAPILMGLAWIRFEDMSEKNKLYFFAGGLSAVPEIVDIVNRMP